jgi:hypothetical protein
MTNEALTITQPDVNGADVKIDLIDGQELRVKRKKSFSTDEYRVNILVLNDKSEKKIKFGWKWLLSGIIASMLLIPKSIGLLATPNLYLEIAFYSGIIISLYCFFMAWETTSLRQIFYSYSTNIPIIELAVGKPSTKEFNTFLKKTEERIRAYREEMNIEPNKQLTGEIKTLRRLRELGVVSEPDYENSKSVLLNQM